MSLLTHPLLKHLAKSIDKGLSPLRWIDLYSAQYVADCHQKVSDAIDASHDERLQDVIVLALMVSFVSSKGETYLPLNDLPSDILTTYQFSDCDFSVWFLQRTEKSVESKSISHGRIYSST